jgi:two-component system response regulator YesN
MYRVLIVDDERLIREGLRGLIDWEALGFQVEAVAADGVEALELLDASPVDLVIADIRMPRMDGLDLLAELRSRGNPVRFLVLSGFAEFEYAQRASAQGIDGYLLKPVDEVELARHLAEVRRRLDSTRFSALTLVQGADTVPPAYAWGRWQVLLLAVPGSSGQPRSLDPDTDRRLRKACRDRGWGELFPEPGAVGLLLRQVYPGGHNLSALARELAAVLGPESARFAGAVGPVVTEPRDVASSLAAARALLAQRFFQTPGTLVWAPRPSAEPGPGPDLTALSEKLALALEAGSPPTVRSILHTAGAALGTGGEEALKEGFSRIVSGAIERYLGHEARSSALRARTTVWVSDLWRQPFLSTLVDYLTDQLETLMTRERTSDAGELVQKMVDLVESRYAENLKLETLADVFRYNSAYLGKLFRQRTGEYFNTYLDQVRIRRAQELLAQGMKVYLVAELVGYRYVDYFHTKFKKYTGVSPSQYRADPDQKTI